MATLLNLSMVIIPRHKSEKIIHKLVMETTAMGNKHWSQIPEGHVAVAAWLRVFCGSGRDLMMGFSRMFRFSRLVVAVSSKGHCSMV